MVAYGTRLLCYRDEEDKADTIGAGGDGATERHPRERRHNEHYDCESVRVVCEWLVIGQLICEMVAKVSLAVRSSDSGSSHLQFAIAVQPAKGPDGHILELEHLELERDLGARHGNE